MAFIIVDNTVTSFAEFQDVVDADQRLLEANEGLTDDVVEPLLTRATERILTKLRATNWWRSYFIAFNDDITITTVADIPPLDVNYILDRQADFTDLCVYTAFADYILPRVADFGNQDNAERQKIGYYQNKATSLFEELVTAGDWYDFDNSGTISSKEKRPGIINPKRIR